MSDTSSLSTKEIVGIAAAGAIALGGLVTALSRSQERGTRDAVASVLSDIGEQLVDQASGSRSRTSELAARLSGAYPVLRSELAEAGERASDELGARRDQLAGVLQSRLPSAPGAPLAEHLEAWLERATGHAREAVEAAPQPVEQVVAHVVPGLAQPNTHRVRDTAIAIALLAIVSSVVYTVFLTEDRRERFKDALCRLLAFGQTLSDDFRGSDDGY
ncbi:MAG: hypothetical protein DCC58_05635 [Chloroflexi bacterium]|nr:MAG: hypothetical protein DCC58_05635 [Chloroflexota bacterium]